MHASWSWVGRRHAGRTSIIIGGEMACLNAKDAHTAYQYVIDSLVNGNFHLIKDREAEEEEEEDGTRYRTEMYKKNSIK